MFDKNMGHRARTRVTNLSLTLNSMKLHYFRNGPVILYFSDVCKLLYICYVGLQNIFGNVQINSQTKYTSISQNIRQF